MKSASLLVILFFSLMLVIFASEMVDAAAAAEPVIVGKWDRTDGVDFYTIYANHVTETAVEGQTYRGTWEYDGTGGYKYIFHWEHGPTGQAPFIDYVTVAADGQSYSGVNNYGDDFYCVRIGDAPSAESGSFPIVPVAIGGGIAAAAIGGAAVYYFVIAGKGAESAASGASSAGAVKRQTNEVAMAGSVLGVAGTSFPPTEEDGIIKLRQQDPLKPAKDLVEQLKTQQAPQQNQDNTQNGGKEKIQQEPSDDSPATQEVADSGESSSAET